MKPYPGLEYWIAGDVCVCACVRVLVCPSMGAQGDVRWTGLEIHTDCSVQKLPYTRVLPVIVRYF